MLKPTPTAILLNTIKLLVVSSEMREEAAWFRVNKMELVIAPRSPNKITPYIIVLCPGKLSESVIQVLAKQRIKMLTMASNKNSILYKLAVSRF